MEMSEKSGKVQFEAEIVVEGEGFVRQAIELLKYLLTYPRIDISE